MVIRITENPPLKALPVKTITVSQFKEGQITEYENDKIPFSASSVLENMVLRKLNLETRKGFTTVYENSGLVGLAQINSTGDPILGAFTAGATTTELASIDVSAGTKTVLVAAATGTQQPSWCNSTNKFYFTVGNNEIHSYDIDTSTAATPLTLVGVKGVTFSDKRVWAFTNDALHYSTVDIDSFSDDLGAYDASTGRYLNGTSHGGQVSLGDLTNLVAAVSVGQMVVIFGKDGLQGHTLPDANSLTYIDPLRPTMQYARKEGVNSPRAVLVRDGFVFFSNKNGFFRLNPRDGGIKKLTQNITQHQALNHDNAALGYDKELSAVLIACKNNGANDTVLSYFTDYDAFSYYKGISAMEFVNIEDKLYCYERTGKKILELFGEDVWTDDGIPVDYLAVTAATDTGVPQYYKKMREMFIDIANGGSDTVYLDIYFDRISGGTKPATTTFPIEWANSPIAFGVYAGNPLGDDPWGMSTVINADGTQEKKIRFKDRTKFGHVEIALRGTTSRRVSWRRFVFEYQELPKKIKSMLLDQ